MKLLWKEHIPLTLVYGGQLLLTLCICLLSGFKDAFALSYIALISTCLYAGYLAYRYIRCRWFYERLNHPHGKLEESMEGGGEAPLPEALRQLLQAQYGLYRNDIVRYRKKLADHITFIHQWAHQMKTPLSVMHLTIQEENDPIFDSVREEMDKLKKGLETVLYTARLDAFEQDFRVEKVRLYELAGKVAADHKNLFIRRQVFPDIRIDRQAMVMSDDKWLAFAIGQLVTNAVRYSAGVGHRVILSSFARGDRVALEVRDEGIGIPKQDLGRVFEPYFTGENGRIYGESTGMGLYLVREIAARLDHRIELESEPGKGTAVRILMPAAPADITTM